MDKKMSKRKDNAATRINGMYNLLIIELDVRQELENNFDNLITRSRL